MIALPIAAALQVGLVAANPPLVRMLRLWSDHDRLQPIAGQIHRVHHSYVAGILLVFAALSLSFPGELASGIGMGRFLSMVMALFWGIRLGVQRLYYDSDFLRAHRGGDVCFSVIFAALFAIYAAAAAGALR
jgi:hypothetical protein